MGEVIDMGERRKSEVFNEDMYRDRVLAAIEAVQAGRPDDAVRILAELLDDFSTVIAGGEL